MLDTSRYADLFLTESRDHLAAMSEALLALERSPRARGPVDAVFRAAHTLKGMSAAMGHDAIAALAHEIEPLLERVRRRELQATRALVDVLLAGADALEAAIAGVPSGGLMGTDDACRAAAHRIAAFEGVTIASSAPSLPTPAAGISAVALEGRLVRIRVSSDVPMRGVRAFLIVRRAESLGRVSALTPDLDALQRGEFGRGFSLRIVTDEPRDAIEHALLAVGDVEAVSVDGEGDAERALEPAAGAHAGVRRHVRVDTRRLDALMNLVGELVIARGRLERIAGAMESDDLTQGVGDAARLIADLQAEIIASRMLPVAEVFERFPRVVRDAARQLGKNAELTIEGGDIELDRSVLDVISEPVMHLLRNAVDHGLESPVERAAAGKPLTGRVTLTASREHASVAIRVRDDGRGVDRERVVAKARALGMLDAAAAPTDDEIADLIARPGFSTAPEVTAFSGRGVGIDVVASTVRRLGGAVEIISVRGEGTCVTLRLPPTLAIVRAVVARVAGETYALPAAHVVTALELDRRALSGAAAAERLATRDGPVPVIRLRTLLEMEPDDDTLKQVVLLRAGERRVALVIDEVVEQREIVVKPFDAALGTAPLFSGATILGDGAPALILDVAQLAAVGHRVSAGGPRPSTGAIAIESRQATDSRQVTTDSTVLRRPQ
ncbi:MAG: chemotaxis protein CheA [Gemmatimonadaceae bacterium]